jgi:hypothetical protein
MALDEPTKNLFSDFPNPYVDRRTTSILPNHDIEDRVRVAQDVKSLVSVWLTLLSKWQCIPNFVIEK